VADWRKGVRRGIHHDQVTQIAEVAVNSASRKLMSCPSSGERQRQEQAAEQDEAGERHGAAAQRTSFDAATFALGLSGTV